MAEQDPPSKRRRVQGRSTNSTPRFSSPDELGYDDRPAHSVSVVSRPTSSAGQCPTKNNARRISIRRRTPSRSPSPDELHDSYYSRSQTRSRSRSRSRTRNSRRSRSRTRNRSRSRDGTISVSRSRTRKRDRSRSRRGGSSGSRSRSLSGSRSGSRDRSRSRSRSRRSRSDSRSRTSSRSRSLSDSRSRSRTSSRTPSPRPYKPACPNFRVKFILRGHTHAVSQVRISPDGNFIASASADGTVRTWNAQTGAHMDTLVGHLAGVSCLAWSPDSRTIATGSDDKAIRLWDRVTGRPKMSAKGARRARSGSKQADSLGLMGPLLGHHNYIHCLAFSPKGNILASGSYDEAVFLWDVRAGRLMRSLPAHSDPVTGIDFSRDGTLVVSCSTDGLTRVWDTSTGQCLRTLVHEDNPGVTSVCFSPNGRFILAFTLDNCIRLWDYVAGSVKKTYQGHQNEKFAIGGCFGVWPRPRGNGAAAAMQADDGEDGANSAQAIIASASEDGSIVLWDVKSKAVVQQLKGHEGVCFWVDVNGGIMASAGQDGVVRVYRDKSRVGTGGGAEPAAAAPSPADGVEKAGLVEKVADLQVEDRDDDMESEEMTADVQIKQEEAEAGADAMVVDGE